MTRSLPSAAASCNGLGAKQVELRAETRQQGHPFFAAIALIMALLLLRTSYWQEETMAARPDEVYRVYSTMMSIMHEEKATRKSLSSRPQPIFDLRAGLFTAHVVGLCSPGASFEFMVDLKACEAKLESFCHSLRDATPNDPHLKLADRLHSTCMDSAKNEKGLAVPLLYGPVEQFWTPEADDWSAEFCRTVANCPRLLAVRSWSWLVVILMLIGVALMTCSCLCLAVAWAKEKPLEQRGFRCGLLALLAFTLGAALYLYVAKAFPLSSLIRSESLFYFMLPEPQEQEPAGRMLVASDGDQPLKRWRSVLLSLTGALLKGLALGDMSLVYKELKESLARAWRLSDVLFQKWLRYMRYALSEAPSERTVALTRVRQQLEDLDGMIQELNGTEVEDLGKQLHEQVREMLAVNLRADALVQQGMALVATISTAWRDLHRPLERLLKRLKAVLHDRHRLQRLFSVAKDVALDEKTAQELKLIFKRLFETVPKVIRQVKALAEDFKRFTSSLGPLARTTYATLQHGLRTLQELRERMKEEAKAAEEFVEDVQEHLERMAASWTPFPVKRLEARLLEELPTKNESVARLVQPLTGTLASPMRQIGGVFMEQLAGLGNSGVRPMQEEQLCSWQMPSACTNLGLGFVGFVLLQVATLIAVVAGRS